MIADSDYLELSYLRKKRKRLLHQIHENNILKIENNINLNYKSFWKHLKLSNLINQLFLLQLFFMVLLTIISYLHINCLRCILIIKLLLVKMKYSIVYATKL